MGGTSLGIIFIVLGVLCVSRSVCVTEWLIKIYMHSVELHQH